MAQISMQGKICLVTGSSSGIGTVTARELARQGATVVIVSRDRARGEATRDEIKKVTGNEQVDLLVADLSVLGDVRRVTADFKQKYTQLHVLINNAGGANHERKVTPDGFETTFAVNYLTPFLLTELLSDVLTASAPARVINVSSSAHTMGRIDFADLQGEKNYSLWKAYGQAKLALLLFTYELADRLKGTGVTVNALHPGVVATNFGKNLGWLQFGWKIMSPFISTTEQGARTTLYLATSSEVERVSGQYFINCQARKSSPRSYDEAVRQRLWQLSQELVQKNWPAAGTV